MQTSQEDKILYYLLQDEDSSSSSSSSTSSSSDPDTEELYKNLKRNKQTKILNFVSVTAENYTEIQFRKHFRMSKSTADYCIAQIKEAQILPQHTFGREKVSIKKGFLMTLWYLANTETFRQISDRFNVAESCAHNVIKKIIGYLVSVSPNYIKWPTEEEAVEIEEEFRKKQGIEGILGAIDGSHILINRPKRDQESYCNRKGTHSILLQGVVDHKRRFIDVFCGEPGSLHDARLLKKSSLYERAQNGSLNFGNRYLLGDSAYPRLPWLVPPKKDNGRLSEEEKIFNFKHSSSRIIVENAFGLLKGRFRRIRHFENKNIKLIVNAVIAVCTLHNICLMKDDYQNIEIYDSDSD